MMNRYLKFAIEQAHDHEYDNTTVFKHCAVIVKGGSIISIGFNKSSTNSFVEYYTDKVRGPNRKYNLSTHAEQDSVLKVRNKTDLTGCKIYVARIRPPTSPDGKVGLSRPCAICRQVLFAYGITKAYYTISDDEYGVMKISKKTINTDFDMSEIFS